MRLIAIIYMALVTGDWSGADRHSSLCAQLFTGGGQLPGTSERAIWAANVPGLVCGRPSK